MIKTITINKVTNGFILSVGSDQLVFDDPMLMMLAISAYLENPDQTTQEWKSYQATQERTALSTHQNEQESL